MKKLMKKLEDIMVAITFAEAGEFDTANEIMNAKTMLLKDLQANEEDETGAAEAV